MPEKVLIVEDDSSIQDVIYAGLTRLGSVEVLRAYTIETARKILAAHSDIAIITLDGCVPGNELNTLPFIGEILASGFTGELIAASSDDAFRDEMMRAGCGRQSSKSRLLSQIVNLLARIRTPTPPHA